MKKNYLIVYLVKFAGSFCLLFFGTKAIIGLTVPGGYYSPFAVRYFDYPSLLRSSLLNGTRLLVAVFGFYAYIRDMYHVTMVNGRGVRLVYACLGYGLLSFWIAFVFANKGSFLKKTKWLTGGCVTIWFINVIRISLVLISANQHWSVPLTLQHHLFYNVVVYISIFLMIWLFHRSDNTTFNNKIYK